MECSEKQRCQRLAHVPFHVIGKHAQEQMRPDTLLAGVADRAHQQIDPLQTAKGTFHQGEVLVAAHRVLGDRRLRGSLVRMT
jgi:hypothetical protein